MNAMCTGSFGDSLCTWLPNNRIDGFPKLKVRKILDTTQRIGTALTYIYEIQHEIYAVIPELKPDFLKE